MLSDHTRKEIILFWINGINNPIGDLRGELYDNDLLLMAKDNKLYTLPSVEAIAKTEGLNYDQLYRYSLNHFTFVKKYEKYLYLFECIRTADLKGFNKRAARYNLPKINIKDFGGLPRYSTVNRKACLEQYNRLAIRQSN